MSADGALQPIAVRAFAKINLSLHVVGVRDDGYHELRTVFQSVALHDTLTMVPRPGPFAIECDEPECPTNERNLVWRAAERVWHEAGRSGPPADVVVRITKRIPMEAGLGGGSSDGAAAMRALAAVWGVRIDRTRLIGMAAELGADVPYFFEGGTALGVRRGDELSVLDDVPPSWVILVLPGFGVSTRQAFLWWDEDWRSRGGALDLFAGESRNDLEAPVVARCPEIGQIAVALGLAGAERAAMSGSGSAVFGLFSTRSAAESAGKRLGNGRRTVVTRTLGRARYTKRSRPRALPRRQPIG